jgi:hypothetical protein
VNNIIVWGADLVEKMKALFAVAKSGKTKSLRESSDGSVFIGRSVVCAEWFLQRKIAEMHII